MKSALNFALVAWQGYLAFDPGGVVYISTDKKMMAVDVKGEATTFQRGTPHALFDGRIPSFNTPLAQFAVSTDDQV
jgi:hypothetical protein